MLSWYDAIKEMEQYQNESHAWAAKERLARQIAQHNARPAKAYQRWLVQLGKRLVAWGYRLQTRYNPNLVISGVLQQDPPIAERPANPCAG